MPTATESHESAGVVSADAESSLKESVGWSEADDQVVERVTDELTPKSDDGSSDKGKGDHSASGREEAGKSTESGDKARGKDGRFAKSSDSANGAPTAGEEPPADAKGSINPELREQAKRLGMTDEDIDGYGDARHVERTVAQLTRLAAGQGAAGANAGGASHGGAARQEGATPQAGSADAGSPPPLPQYMDEEATAYFQYQQNQVNELTQRLANVEQFYARQSSAEVTAWFDKRIAELGEEFTPVFGKGDVKTIGVDSPQGHKRGEVLTLARGLLTGGQAKDRDEAVDMALRALHYPIIEKQQQRELADKLRSQSKQRLGGDSSKKVRESEPYDGDLINDPVLKERFDSYQRQNG